MSHDQNYFLSSDEVYKKHVHYSVYQGKPNIDSSRGREQME